MANVKPWGDAWDEYENVSLADNGIVIYYTESRRSGTAIQFYLDGSPSTPAYAGDKWTWISLTKNNIDELITALEYAKLKISQT